MRSMDHSTGEINTHALLEEFAQVLWFVQMAYQRGCSAQEVECGLWQRIRNLGCSLHRKSAHLHAT
jgi:hypothetical protein